MTKASKKIIVFLLAVVMVAGLLAGCASGGSASTPVAGAGQSTGGATGGEAGGETFKFSYTIQQKFIDWANELKWWDVALERNNVEVEFISGGSTDSEYSSGIDQQIISGTFPDAGIVTQNQGTVYGAEGAFLDLAPYIAEHAPNIQAYLDANEEFRNYVTTADGQIFALACEGAKMGDLLFYRSDMFEKAGVTDIPTDVDGFTEVMRTLKEFYGADNANYYPMSGREHFIRFQGAFNCYPSFDGGVSNGLYYYPNRSFDIHAEGFREMIEWYIMLYDEGLINPEWVAGASTEELWEADLLTGMSSIGYDFYTRPAWFMINGGPDNDPDYNIEVMTYLTGPSGDKPIQLGETQYKNDRSIAINANAEDKAVQIIQFVDFFFSEEGQTLCTYGVEGESYKEENGEKTFIVDFSDEEGTPSGEKRWSFLNDRLTIPKPIDNDGFYKWNTELVAEAAARNYPDHLQYATILIYNEEQAKEYNNIVATLDEAVRSGIAQFVSGQRAMGEFDAWLDEMDNMGYTRALEIQQEVYDAQYK